MIQNIEIQVSFCSKVLSRSAKKLFSYRPAQGCHNANHNVGRREAGLVIP